MKRHLIGVAAAVLGTMLIGGVVVQTAAAADPVPTTVTLPLFGAPLTIGITTGPGGALTEVTVDPADGNVATQLKPHKVVFQSANLTDPTGDPGKVVVKSRHGGQSVSARAGSLADVSGPGTWSGDVFGDGTASTVAFSIAAAADGSPDITGISTTGAAAVVGDVKHSAGDDDDDESSMSARVSVRFTNAGGDQSRSVTVSVKVRTDEDGTTSARVSISLSGLKGVAVDAAVAAGPHSWSGVLCDNSAATITYDVAADGSVSNVVATPATDEVRAEGSKIEVRFSHDERVRIRVRESDGLVKISVDERIRCDSPNPTTNVSTSIPADDDEGDGHGGNDHNEGGHHGGGGGHDDDDTSTTDVTTTTSA
ncbi:MAG: hypothetical protein ABI862_13860 [Ilumatobacteraceae bacterium]